MRTNVHIRPRVKRKSALCSPPFSTESISLEERVDSFPEEEEEEEEEELSSLLQTFERPAVAYLRNIRGMLSRPRAIRYYSSPPLAGRNVQHPRRND